MSTKVEQNQKTEEVVVKENEQATQMVEVKVEPKKKFKMSPKVKTGLLVGGVSLVTGFIGFLIGSNKSSKEDNYYDNTIIDVEPIEVNDETISE